MKKKKCAQCANPQLKGLHTCKKYRPKWRKKPKKVSFSVYTAMANAVYEAFFHAEHAEDESDKEVAPGAYTANQALSKLVELMDGDANDRLLEALKRIDFIHSPSLYVQPDELVRKKVLK